MKHAIAGASAVLLALSSTAIAQTREIPYHPHYFGGDGFFLGPIMMILVLAVIVGIVLLIIRSFSGSGRTFPSHSAQQKTPFNILQERFARGEIDKDEFEDRRKILGE